MNKTCRKCGATFAPSRADSTVHCPDCRRRPTTSSSDERYTVEIAKAKSRGYAARRDGDTVAYERAIADLRHWQNAREAAR